jgi:hypothetical protein
MLQSVGLVRGLFRTLTGYILEDIVTEEALCSFTRRFRGVICDFIGDTLVTSTQLVDFRRYHSGQNDGDRELVTDFVRLLVRTGIHYRGRKLREAMRMRRLQRWERALG